MVLISRGQDNEVAILQQVAGGRHRLVVYESPVCGWLTRRGAIEQAVPPAGLAADKSVLAADQPQLLDISSIQEDIREFMAAQRRCTWPQGPLLAARQNWRASNKRRSRRQPAVMAAPEDYVGLRIGPSTARSAVAPPALWRL